MLTRIRSAWRVLRGRPTKIVAHVYIDGKEILRSVDLDGPDA